MNQFCLNLVWLKIYTNKLYIAIPVWVTFALVQGCRDARKQTFLYQLFYKIFDQFGWNLIVVEMSWSDEPWTNFI